MFGKGSDGDLCHRFVLRRLNRERVTELQQQVEDLQKALQSQAAKPDDVSVTGVISASSVFFNRWCRGTLVHNELVPGVLWKMIQCAEFSLVYVFFAIAKSSTCSQLKQSKISKLGRGEKGRERCNLNYNHLMSQFSLKISQNIIRLTFF